MNDPIIIVGAGLSGLRAASLLIEQGINCRVLESRGRIGGRVLSSLGLGSRGLDKFDLGPTWFWPHYEQVITRLVKELGLHTFDQHIKGDNLLERFKNEPAQRYLLPEGAVERSTRFKGGVQSLIDAVAATLPPGTIEMNTRVTTIRREDEEKITVEALVGNKKIYFRPRAVILALPPRLVANHIDFSPSLSPELMGSLLNKPTWMGGQAKVIAVYDRPFWREHGLSGQVTSWIGPLQEIHDASPQSGSGALFGFFRIPAKMRQGLGEEKIFKLVVEQLTRLFGASANKPVDLLYKDWSTDNETAVAEDITSLSDFPRYGPPTGIRAWEKKLFFAGTETDSEFGGHLEGALRSAERVVSEINEIYKAPL
ncbi:FAD-dependent oxidoreductase [Bacillus sp. SM2101]|uniref:flavin monoamine oxidase family protein n=1 Tax=Bacillus sp. SM2101 TaxID=2805366 RepID=UPI001BDDFC9B|nr:FAD-dependent oxidoreductase [Bacillus sp. SM2101]